MNDELIIKMYLKRDESAIAVTQERYQQKLHRISHNLILNVEDANECVNDTYLKAWNSIPPNEPYGYFFSFLAKITRNLSLDAYRKKHRQKRHAEIISLTAEVEQCIPSKEVESEGELVESINRFLYSVKSDERIAFVLRYWHFEPISKIAKKMGFSESKVKSMLFRTRNRLRIHLDKKEGTI